jgi:hypothetical protein
MRAGLAFSPLIVGWEELDGGEADQEVGGSSGQAHRAGQEEAENTRHLFQRLAVLLAKGNAALFLNRVPCHPSAVIDGTN